MRARFDVRAVREPKRRRALRPALIALVIAIVPAAAMAAPAAGAGIETLTLDTHDSTTNAGYVWLTSSTSLLASTKPYIIEVQGTMSFWSAHSWSSKRFFVCGTAETQPQIPSPGVTSTPVGIDAESRFALLRGVSTACPATPSPTDNFQVSTGGPFSHPSPLSTSNAGSHDYRYPAIGANQPVTFRFYDPHPEDNSGQFRITLTVPTTTDCAGSGATALGFSSEAACTNYVNNTPAAGSAESLKPANVLDLLLSPTVTTAASRACTSRRAFDINIPEHGVNPIVSATVSVAGTKTAVKRDRKTHRLVAHVSLLHKPKGRFAVQIYVKYRSGKKGQSVRRYHTCAVKHK